jgi:hypothetical protein
VFGLVGLLGAKVACLASLTISLHCSDGTFNVEGAIVQLRSYSRKTLISE